MFTSNSTHTVTFYMKSGNKIVVKGVKPGFVIKYEGNTVLGISKFEQTLKTRLMIGSLDLSQIEAITY